MHILGLMSMWDPTVKFSGFLIIIIIDFPQRGIKSEIILKHSGTETALNLSLQYLCHLPLADVGVWSIRRGIHCTKLNLELLIFQTSSPDSSNENSPATPPDEQGQGDAPPQLEEEEPAFPHTDLAKLDDMINRWAGLALSGCDTGRAPRPQHRAG